MAYVFTEGSNKDLVYSILGDFWTSFFKDTFLVEGVINANTLSLDEFSNNLSKLTDTLNERTCPKIVPTSIYRLDIEDTNINYYVNNKWNSCYTPRNNIYVKSLIELVYNEFINNLCKE